MKRLKKLFKDKDRKEGGQSSIAPAGPFQFHQPGRYQQQSTVPSTGNVLHRRHDETPVEGLKNLNIAHNQDSVSKILDQKGQNTSPSKDEILASFDAHTARYYKVYEEPVNLAVPPQQLCSFCAGIPVELIVGPCTTPYTHHPNYPSLRTSAESGCALCAVLLTYVEKILFQDAPPPDLVNSASVPLASEPIVLRYRKVSYVPPQLRVALGHELSAGPTVQSIQRTGQADGNRIAREGVSGASPPSNVRWKIAGARGWRVVTPRNDSDEAFELINYWLRGCLDNHERCRSLDVGANRKLPRMLLDIGPDGIDISAPRLVLTENLDPDEVQYLCLSYCWGTSGSNDRALTMTWNLESRMRRISNSQLSPVMLHAMLVTSRLHFRYIWIDALCIVQDSLEDWQLQCAVMGEIYAHAACTISASASSDSIEGIFRRRPPAVSERAFLTWEEYPDVKIELRPYQRKERPRFETSPVQTRAWCLQERLLSPRVVHFAEGELFWECECATAFESDFWPDSYFANAKGLTGQPLDRAQNPHGEIEEELYEAWHERVEEFSHRSLTKATDRLPAISAIVKHNFLAKLQEGVPDEEYVAGLFLKDIQRGLLWTKNCEYPGQLARSAEYVAPSWSWASVTGPVRMPPRAPLIGKGVHVVGQDGTSEIIYGARKYLGNPGFLDAGTTPTGPDPLGQISAGFIGLRAAVGRAANAGPLDPAKYPYRCFLGGVDSSDERAVVEARRNMGPCHEIKDEFGGRMWGFVYFDDPADAHIEVLLLVRGAVYADGEEAEDDGGMPKACAHFLVVVPAGDLKESYLRRVGVGSTALWDWFDGRQEFNIRII